MLVTAENQLVISSQTTHRSVCFIAPYVYVSVLAIATYVTVAEGKDLSPLSIPSHSKMWLGYNQRQKSVMYSYYYHSFHRLAQPQLLISCQVSAVSSGPYVLL